MIIKKDIVFIKPTIKKIGTKFYIADKDREVFRINHKSALLWLDYLGKTADDTITIRGVSVLDNVILSTKSWAFDYFKDMSTTTKFPGTIIASNENEIVVEIESIIPNTVKTINIRYTNPKVRWFLLKGCSYWFTITEVGKGDRKIAYLKSVKDL